MHKRGYNSFNDMWNDVTGNGDPTNQAFAVTGNARYLSRSNPKLDAKTAADVTLFYILSGLLPTDFYNGDAIQLSFNSSKTASHNTPPSGPGVFATLEAFPHNKVHNYIGGYGAHDAPWGNMTNNLSPVDPIFFLHHSNMDRLWDVWTRKQKRLGLPYLPTKPDELRTYAGEPFLFYVDGNGRYVGPSTAGKYVSTRCSTTTTSPEPAKSSSTVRNRTRSGQRARRRRSWGPCGAIPRPSSCRARRFNTISARRSRGRSRRRSR